MAAVTKDMILAGHGDGKIEKEDAWQEAANILTEKNYPQLTKEDSKYWYRWREYYTQLIYLKNKGYELIIKK